MSLARTRLLYKRVDAPLTFRTQVRCAEQTVAQAGDLEPKCHVYVL